MSLFVIGDLQGCAAQLQALVEGLPIRRGDELWLCGDLINRGPDSLGTLRWLRDYPGTLRCVLGNHDLAVLAHARGAVQKCGRTAQALRAADDGPVLLDWLQQQPLLVEAQGLVMVHAGLPPAWTLDEARACSDDLQRCLTGPDAMTLLGAMYGDEPRQWSADLPETERRRFAVNALTRMRFVDRDGGLDMTHKGEAASVSADLMPWFAHPERQTRGQPIAFGHWSTLERNWWPEHSVWGLDGGCVWGGRLTALQWPERRLFRLPCPAHQRPGTD